MSLQILKRKPAYFLYGGGLLLLAVAGVLWWNTNNAKPERVFWGMVEQSLSTSGVTVQASQTGSNGPSVQQTMQFSLGGQNTSHSLTTLRQGGTTVQDEMIATPGADYTRYTSIKTDQKGAGGKALNFSTVIGVWAKRDMGGQLFSQNLLGTNLPLGGVAVPIANLSPELRHKLVKQMKDQGVYRVSFKEVKKQHVEGRAVYVYTVTVQPVPYASMMKSLAKSAGLHDLDALDPTTFAAQKPYQIRLTVDAHARHLRSAEAVGANIKQTYTSYDIPVVVALPEKPISGTELQKRLTEIQ